METVIAIHDAVINSNELQGLAPDKSLESRLMRVENRLNYGLIDDVFSLAAIYARCIATGHCFNDANKRTAVNAMDVCLVVNSIEMDFAEESLGNIIILIANGNRDESYLARWLRELYRLTTDI